VDEGRISGRRRSVVFWTATALIGLDTLLFTMVAPALPVFAEREGFDDTVAALIFAAYPVAQLATGLASAGLVERIGRRPLLIAAPCGLALATFAFALAGDPAALALARLAQGAAAGVTWTAGIAAISDVYPSTQLGFRIGLAETVGGAIGLAGPLAGGAMVDAFGTTTAFAAAAVLPLVAVLPILAVPETRRPRDPMQERIGVVAALRRVSGLPRAQVAIVSLVVLAAVLALLEPLLPLDLDERLGLSPLQIGIVFAVGDLAYLLSIAPAGRWSDRRGRRLPTVLGGVMVAAFLPLTAFGPAWFVALAFVGVGAGLASLGASSGALMVEAVDQAGMAGRYGLSGAMLTAVFSAGYVLGPLLGAGASAMLPYAATAALAAVLCLVATGWIARTLPREQVGPRALARGPKGREYPR
jgi:MFS family permease